MFEFINDLNNYEARCIARDDFDWGFISTASVSDGRHPHETAIRSNEYAPPDDLDERNKIIIVEAYDSVADAKAGHAKWIDIMNNNPPQELVDCCNAGIGELIEKISGAPTEVRVKDRDKQ